MSTWLCHYGVSKLDGAPGRGSGRYPLGSGDEPFHHMSEEQFRTLYDASTDISAYKSKIEKLSAKNKRISDKNLSMEQKRAKFEKKAAKQQKKAVRDLYLKPDDYTHMTKATRFNAKVAKIDKKIISGKKHIQKNEKAIELLTKKISEIEKGNSKLLRELGYNSFDDYLDDFDDMDMLEYRNSL